MLYTTAIVFIILYYLAFLLYYRSLFPAKKNRIVFIALTLLVIVGTYIYPGTMKIQWLRLMIIMGVMALGLRFSSNMDWRQALYGGNTGVISAYCFRGIFVAFTSIGFIDERMDFLLSETMYHIMTLLALPSALVFFLLLRRTLLPDDKIKRFLKNRSQLKMVVAYEMTAIANLTIINQGRFLSIHAVWYTFVGLGACVLTLGMLVYSVYQSIRSTELLENQWQTKTLEEQYARQLLHYRSYQKHTESFRAFRHDYKAMMITLKSLIRSNENEEALRLLETVFDSMQKKVQMHKRYSDSPVLDSMMQEFANLCEAHHVHLSFQACAPKNTALSLLDAVQIFANLTNNALEASLKIPQEKRFIEIVTGNENDWVTLQVKNSFNGELLLENGKIITTKPEKEHHGLGMGIIKEIAEKLGGFVIYDTDMEKNIFLVRVHVPRLQSDEVEE